MALLKTQEPCSEYRIGCQCYQSSYDYTFIGTFIGMIATNSTDISMAAKQKAKGWNFMPGDFASSLRKPIAVGSTRGSQNLFCFMLPINW